MMIGKGEINNNNIQTGEVRLDPMYSPNLVNSIPYDEMQRWKNYRNRAFEEGRVSPEEWMYRDARKAEANRYFGLADKIEDKWFDRGLMFAKENRPEFYKVANQLEGQKNSFNDNSEAMNAMRRIYHRISEGLASSLDINSAVAHQNIYGPQSGYKVNPKQNINNVDYFNMESIKSAKDSLKKDAIIGGTLFALSMLAPKLSEAASRFDEEYKFDDY